MVEACIRPAVRTEEALDTPEACIGPAARVTEAIDSPEALIRGSGLHDTFSSMCSDTVEVLGCLLTYRLTASRPLAAARPDELGLKSPTKWVRRGGGSVPAQLWHHTMKILHPSWSLLPCLHPDIRCTEKFYGRAVKQKVVAEFQFNTETSRDRGVSSAATGI